MPADNQASAEELKQAKEMARLVIAHHFGNRKPRRIVRRTGGLSNFVFSISHAEGEFTVRLSFDPTRISLFIKEQWAQAQAQEIGVPIAEILEVSNEVIGHPFMIVRTIKGQEATFHPQRAEIVRDMGRYAALINTIHTNGYGGTFDWSNNQLSYNKTWAEFVEKELQLEQRLETLIKQKMLSEAQSKKIRAIFRAAGKQDAKPALNHGDMRLKNVLVSEAGEIQAIIDWEHCVSNLAPAWDLSLALHDLAIDEKQHFLDGYGLTEKKLEEIAPLMKAINIINYAPHIAHLAADKETTKLTQYRTRLAGTLDLYSL